MKQSQYPGLSLSEPKKDTELVRQFEEFVKPIFGRSPIFKIIEDTLAKNLNDFRNK